MEESDRFDLSVIIATAKRVITNPGEFYQSMARTGGYGNPAVFVAVMAVAGGLIGSVWALLGAGPAAGLASGVATVIVLPIVMVIGSFVLALILFVIWKLMGSTHGYETAYRCVAFAMAILPVVGIVSLIPYIGQILQTAWSCWLMYIASIHVHKISGQTAKIVFAVLAGLLIISNVKGEHQARKFESFAEELEEKLTAVAPTDNELNVTELDSTQLGKAAAGFLEGLQEGSSGTALSEQQKKELERAGAAVGKIVETMQTTAREFEDKNPEDITPKDAGAAMGALFKSLQDAAQSMPGNTNNRTSDSLAARAPALSSMSAEDLTPLGVISKPSQSHAIGLTVNDDARFAPVAGQVSVYRDKAGIRYRVPIEKAYMSEFTSLGENTAATTSTGETTSDVTADEGTQEQNIVVSNAGILVYNPEGRIVSGDECGQGVLQIPRQTAGSDLELWLWCPSSQRSTTTR